MKVSTTRLIPADADGIQLLYWSTKEEGFEPASGEWDDLATKTEVVPVVNGGSLELSTYRVEVLGDSIALSGSSDDFGSLAVVWWREGQQLTRFAAYRGYALDFSTGVNSAYPEDLYVQIWSEQAGWVGAKVYRISPDEVVAHTLEGEELHLTHPFPQMRMIT